MAKYFLLGLDELVWWLIWVCWFNYFSRNCVVLLVHLQLLIVRSCATLFTSFTTHTIYITISRQRCHFQALKNPKAIFHGGTTVTNWYIFWTYALRSKTLVWSIRTPRIMWLHSMDIPTGNYIYLFSLYFFLLLFVKICWRLIMSFISNKSNTLMAQLATYMIDKSSISSPCPDILKITGKSISSTRLFSNIMRNDSRRQSGCVEELLGALWAYCTTKWWESRRHLFRWHIVRKWWS